MGDLAVPQDRYPWICQQAMTQLQGVEDAPHLPALNGEHPEYIHRKR